MNDPAIFANFLESVLQVRPARVREEITSFIGTFEDLLSSSDDEIDAFVKEVHSGNSARATNAKLLIGPNVVLGLKSVLFELKDRDACDALPNETVLNALDSSQLSSMRKLRRQAIISQALRKEVTLPDMKVPKLTAQTFDDWNTSFSTVVGRQNSLAGISLNYLLRDEEVGNYNANWPSREEKLKFCIKLHGSRYKSDTEALYSLLVEHIGTVGCGSNLIIKHKRFKEGRRCYLELKSHFHNQAYKQNLATTANKSLADLKYYGDRRNFTLETYYDIISKNFNMLEMAGTAHLLTEEQKIIKFEAGLKEEKAISYSITSKSIWDSLPENNQTFDSYYNTFSSFMNKHNTLLQGNQRSVQISSAFSERQQPSRKRIRQMHRAYPNRRGRGRGRGTLRSRAYNPHSIVKNFRESFRAEAKIYSKEEYNNLTPSQKSQIHELKLKSGWLDGRTPPPGFQINPHTGKAEPNIRMVSTIGAAASNTYYNNRAHTQSRVGFSSPPHVIGESIATATDDTGTVQLGTSFGRPGKRHTSSSDSTISSVTCNGRTYHGPVFDERGHRLN